jgi:uncharacterized protein (DUF1697 family)
MPRYIALLRAVNVGGTGALPMAELKAMCVDAGFTRVETYIASGNVVFDSKAAAKRVKAELESRLHVHAKRPVGVVVRTAAEMADVLKANPFRRTEPKYTYAVFLDARPPRDALDHAVGANGEEMALGKREIFIHYPNGMGRSRLRIPAAKEGTARNMNTVAKVAELAAER